jgi:hypothetical protein
MVEVFAPLSTAGANRTLKLNVVCFLTFFPLVNLGVFADDDFDQALFLHAVEAVLDLVFVRHEQRASSLERNANLDAGKATDPTEDDPPHCAGHAALCEDKVGDGRESAGV